MEKANGDSEICRPFTVGFSSPATCGLAGSYRSEDGTGGEQQPLTIFYGGKVCVCEVTEEQARAILYFAKQEFDSINSRGASFPKEKQRTLAYHYHQGHCMKRSLQRFLQERKIRAMEASPYSRRP